ncbi:MFS general substrate transporter [Melanogaster broomeanus]|nr:MFS general substrate transporter [Melanogaster broomeanus]
MAAGTFEGVGYTRLPVNDSAVELHQDAIYEAVLHSSQEDRERVEKNLLRKLDTRMSMLMLIYILNYIDRNNVAAARLRGFEEDLHLEGQQFNTVLSILYVGYILMQIPSNMFLNCIGKPSIYLPGCMAIWGVISVLTVSVLFIVFSGRYTGVLVTRFCVGFVEAAFFPGALFLLSKWYKRRELGERIAILTCGAMLSNAFGSLLASAILDIMDGVWGYAAWRWLFYVEGTLTVVVALCATCVLPDFPSTPSRWLTPEEHALAQIRMEEDGGEDEESEDSKSLTSGLIQALSDWKVWWLCIAETIMAVYLSFNAFFPTLGATMGYNPTVTLLLCSPPWALATFLAFKTSRHSDADGERFLHIVVPSFLGIVGFLMAMSTMNTAVRYMSMFLLTQSYTAGVVFWAWVSNSISRPPSKRAVALAFINSLSTVGKIIGSYVWPSKWGPSYANSCAICIAANTLFILMLWVFRQHLRRLNEELEAEDIKLGRPKGLRYLL